MTAPASRPVRRGSTVYVCPTSVTEVSPTSYVVTSKPPLHSATVVRTAYNGLWSVTFGTIDIPRVYRYADMRDALRSAGDLVGRKAGQEWKERFTGPQRYAMGQQQCPRLMGAGMGVCGEPPEPGTVWCRWHPKGKEVMG